MVRSLTPFALVVPVASVWTAAKGVRRNGRGVLGSSGALEPRQGRQRAGRELLQRHLQRRGVASGHQGDGDQVVRRADQGGLGAGRPAPAHLPAEAGSRSCSRSTGPGAAASASASLGSAWGVSDALVVAARWSRRRHSRRRRGQRDRQPQGQRCPGPAHGESHRRSDLQFLALWAPRYGHVNSGEAPATSGKATAPSEGTSRNEDRPLTS